MEGSIECFDTLICSGARRLTGYQCRLFMAEVTTELCKGSARQAERRFGWGRETVLKGLHEARQGMRCLENFGARGRLRSEEKDPQLAADIRAIVEPHTYADPELKSPRRYTNLSAAEVRQALIDKGHSEKELPRERTMRDILNRITIARYSAVICSGLREVMLRDRGGIAGRWTEPAFASPVRDVPSEVISLSRTRLGELYPASTDAASFDSSSREGT